LFDSRQKAMTNVSKMPEIQMDPKFNRIESSWKSKCLRAY